jgi:gliding motility-associated-like protein
MKISKILLVIIFPICFSANINAQFIQVDDTKTAQELVQNVLINSPCANVSNFTVKGDDFSGSEKSYGYFSAGSSTFPFMNGVVLSTSRANKIPGPNDNLIDEGSTSWLGDSDLETAVGFTNTFNATALEFDFTPLTSKISFDYLFASEEYQGTAPCRYSDAFAFLLKPVGATTPYQNLAIIPGTSSPVLVTSVHPEILGGNGCPSINEAFFGNYNAVNSPINLNGQTKVLTAFATVIPGTTYHIKLVIADHENIRYDSAIFLGGGSFKVGVDLGNDKIVANNNAICTGDIKILDATQFGINTYKWFKNGIQIPNEFNPTYQITDNTNINEVIYSVEVALSSSICIVKGEVKIQFAAKPFLNNQTLIECDDNSDGKTKFDLTKLDNLIRNNTLNSIPLTALNLVKYYEDSSATILITNPSSFINSTINQQIIFAKVENTFGCSSIATVTLNVSNNNISQTINLCDTDSNQNGITSIDLTLQITPALIPAIPATFSVRYYPTKPDAIAQINELSNVYTNTSANQQIIFGRLINGQDCDGILEITLNILSFDPEKFKDKTLFICPSKTLKLEVPAGFQYVWSNGNISDNFINVATSGIYTVKITNSNNCSIIKKFDVQNSDVAIISSIEVNDFNDNDNSVLVIYSGIGNYQFSLDGLNFQDNPLFTNVAIGEYFITIQDKNKCGKVVSNKIFVLDFPKFFTPNDDGINDYWKINNLNKKSTIDIYDRFGKFLYQINANSNGWNGTFNEQMLLADDYWFVLTLENNRIIKNHFALKR